MKLGVTIAKTVSGSWETIYDANTPFPEQRRGFVEVCNALRGTHDEVWLISSAMGRVKRRKLKDVVTSAEVGSEDSDETSNTEQTTKPELL